MNVRPAFDTNIVLYLLSSGEKRDIAAELLSEGGAISVQVLNEVANVMRRKQHRNWEEIEKFTALLASVCSIKSLDRRIQQQGLEIARQHQLSIYDSMIVASAYLSHCRILYSEDMQHGFEYRSVRILNPFYRANSTPQ